MQIITVFYIFVYETHWLVLTFRGYIFHLKTEILFITLNSYVCSHKMAYSWVYKVYNDMKV